MSTEINITKKISIKDEGNIITPNVNTINFTGSGVTASTVGDDVTVNIAGASGIFGISNSNGIYTYYTTPTLAYAAATAGQTIEMFADYTSSGVEELAITKNVNWNGNGHTWTKSATGTTHIITCALATCDFRMTGLNLLRTNGTSTDYYASTCFYAQNLAAGKIYMDGCFFETRNSGASAVALCMYPSSLEIIGLTCKSIAVGAFIGSSNTTTNCFFHGTTGVDMRGIANFCYAKGTTGSGISANAATLNSCIGVSVSGSGISGGGYMYNSIGRSTSSYGIESNNVTDLIACTGISVSGQGIWLYNSTSKSIIGNTGISSSNYGIRFQMSYCFNSTAISTSNSALFDTASYGKIYNCNMLTSYNNAVGYGIIGNGSLPVSIINCQFQLANATAPYIYNVGSTAAVIKMRGNTYEGGAAFNANITQGIITTEDNQGNIYI